MREPLLERAHDCGLLERAGLLWLAAGSVLLGLLPRSVLSMLDNLNQLLLSHRLGNSAVMQARALPQKTGF